MVIRWLLSTVTGKYSMDDAFSDSPPLRFLKIKLFLSKKEWEGKFNLNLFIDRRRKDVHVFGAFHLTGYRNFGMVSVYHVKPVVIKTEGKG